MLRNILLKVSLTLIVQSSKYAKKNLSCEKKRNTDFTVKKKKEEEISK